MAPQMPGYQGDSQSHGPRGPADDQLWSLLSYLLALVLSIIAPLVIYLVKKDESRFVRHHSAQALNMGITGVIYSFGGIILGIIVGIATHGVGLILMIVLLFAYGVAHLVYLILAAIAAYRGDLYRVPAAICLPMVH